MKHEIQRTKEAWYKFKALDRIGNYDVIYGYMLLASAFAIIGCIVVLS